jgi:hypothetical protein
MALRGLWGSLFSAEGGFFKGGPKRLFGRIDVVAGRAIDPADVSPEHLGDQIRALRGNRR